MNKRYLLRFSADYFLSFASKKAGIILLIVICTLCCGALMFLRDSVSSQQNRLGTILSDGTAASGVVISDGLPVTETLNALESRGIHPKSFGRISEFGITATDNLSQSLAEEFDPTATGFGCILMPERLIRLCRLSLQKGELPESFEDNTLYLLLGSDYSDSFLNTEMSGSDLFGDYRIKVCGKLEKNSFFLTNDLAELEPTNTNHLILAFGNITHEKYIQYENISSMIYLSADSPEAFTDMRKSIFDLVGGEDVSIQVISFDDYCRDLTQSGSVLEKYLGDISFFFLCVAVITLFCTHMVMVLQSRQIYGIWFANGASFTDVLLTILISSLIELAIALLLAYVLALFLLKKFAGVDALSIGIMQVAFLKSGLLMSLVDLLSLSIPLAIIRKEPPAHMIKELMN